MVCGVILCLALALDKPGRLRLALFLLSLLLGLFAWNVTNMLR
jgi:hypothetical protein